MLLYLIYQYDKITIHFLILNQTDRFYLVVADYSFQIFLVQLAAKLFRILKFYILEFYIILYRILFIEFV